MVTALCRFTAHGVFMPSSSLSVTSDGTPRIVDVIGATVTEDKYKTALSRVRTTTGRLLSGGANWYSRMSPLAILLAMPLPPPKRRIHPVFAAVGSNRHGRAPPGSSFPAASDARAARLAPRQTDFVSSAARPGLRHVRVAYQGLFARSPYCRFYSTIYSTPHIKTRVAVR